MNELSQITIDGPLDRVPYHIGIAAASMEQGQDILTRMFGVDWAPPIETQNLPFYGPDGPIEVSVSVAHSLGGPMRFELCVGSLYPVTGDLALHHFAYWSTDVAADVADLEPRGWTVEVCARDEVGTPVEFAYLTKPGQFRVEFVDDARRPRYSEVVGVDVPLQP